MRQSLPWILVAIVGLHFTLDASNILTSRSGRLLKAAPSSTSKRKMGPYSQDTIAAIAPLLQDWHPRLLVFNGLAFEVYNLDHADSRYWEDPSCQRCGAIVPLLVHALKELKPQRFQRGQPMFQLLFSDADYVSSNCVNPGACPNIADVAPLLLFGSSPKDQSLMPTVQGFPHVYYIDCLYQYKLHGVGTCEWPEIVDRDLPWDSLKPTIIWRGSDFDFIPYFNKYKGSGPISIKLSNTTTDQEALSQLFENWNQLTPRWRSAALTVQAERNNDTWIDSKFIFANKDIHKKLAQHGVEVGVKEGISPGEMSTYKYLIDTGGYGGTSWRGTISKLAMP